MTNCHKWEGDKALTSESSSPSTRANPLLFPPQFYTAFRSEISKAISHRERGVGTYRAAGLRDFCILPTPAKCKILCIGAEEEKRREERRGEEIDGGGILKTRNWRNDGFAEAERREVHSLTRRLCEGNYAKEEKRRRGRGRVGSKSKCQN